MLKPPEELTFADLEEADRELEAAEDAYDEAIVRGEGQVIDYATARHEAARKHYLTVLGILERREGRFTTAERM